MFEKASRFLARVKGGTVFRDDGTLWWASKERSSLGWVFVQLARTTYPRDELQSKTAEVATIAEKAQSSLGSQAELEHLLKKKEAEQAEAARALALKEEERAALESRCACVCVIER